MSSSSVGDDTECATGLTAVISDDNSGKTFEQALARKVATWYSFLRGGSRGAFPNLGAWWILEGISARIVGGGCDSRRKATMTGLQLLLRAAGVAFASAR